jgi:hypothetical protein
MTLEVRSEQPEVQPPCFEPVITGPRTRSEPRRTVVRHDRHNNAAPQLIAASPAAPDIEIRDYESLIDMARVRADDLQISRETIDRLAGWADGLASKILSPNRQRRAGPDTIEPLLSALCIKLIPVADDAAFARHQRKMVKRNDALCRSKAFRKISGTITARMFGWPAP